MPNRFLNNIRINDEYTLPAADGTADQIITTDGAGQLSFVDPSTITAGTAEKVVIYAKNTHTASIAKGTPVYITGTVGATDTVQIAPADASNSAKMPAVGILDATLAVNAFGYVITGGFMDNITTDPIDGATPSSNDTVYVKAGGGLTLTKPTGSDLIQNIAKVGKVSGGNAGSLIVSSILRTNDVPNLTTGKIWVGTAANTAESSVVFLDEPNGRMGIGTTSPTYKLQVAGKSYLSGGIQMNSGDEIDFGNGNQYITGVNDTSLTLATGGSATLTATHTGNVGIGTTNPSQKLDVNGAIITEDYRAASVFYLTSGGDWRFRTDTGIERVRITSAGNVGIGETLPDKKLEVSGNIKISGGDYNGLYFENAAGTEKTLLYQHANYDALVIKDLVNNADRVTFKNNGNVGIGETNPSSKFVVKDGSSTFAFAEYNNGATIWLDGSDGDFVGGDYFNISAYGTTDLAFGYAAGTKMVLKSSGDVGIGTTSPSSANGFDAKLQLESANPMLVYKETDQTTKWEVGAWGGNYVVYNGTNERMRINSSGNVGIGTTTPGAKLDVNGSIKATSGQTFGTDSQSASIYMGVQNQGLYGNFGGYARNLIKSNNNNIVEIGHVSYLVSGISLVAGSSAVNGTITFSTKASERMRIDSDGNVMIGNTSAAAKLDIRQDSGVAIRCEDGTGGYFVVNQGGNTGIGTTSPAEKLTVSGDSNITGKLAVGSSSAHGTYDFYNQNTAYFNGAVTVDDVFTQSGGSSSSFSGNVGIGTTSPSQKLHVDGNARVTGAYYDSNNSAGTSGQVLSSTATGTDWVSLSEIAGVDGTGTANTLAMWSDADTITDAPITVSGNDATFAGNISAVGGAFTSPVTIYDVDATENPRLSIGRQGAESLQFDVEDTIATIRHKQDADSNADHFLDFIIDSTSTGNKQYRFKQAGNTSSTYLTLDSSAATFAGDVAISSTMPKLTFTDLQQDDWRIMNDNGDFRFTNIDGTGHALVFATNNNATFAGDIGIGVSPSQPLDVNGTALIRNTIYVGDDIQHWGDGGTGMYFGTDTISLKNDGGSTRLFVKSGGNVGIGTTNPQNLLHLGDNTNSKAGTIRIDSFVANQFWKIEPGTNTLNIKDYDGTSLVSFNGASNYVLFNSGNVGIGTTTPQKKLDVYLGTNSAVASIGGQISAGEYAGLHFGYSETGNSSYRHSAIVFERDDTGFGDARGKIHILNSPSGSTSADLGDARLTILPSGDVGIGTTSPQSKLHVARQGNANGGSILMGEGGSGTNKWSYLAGTHYNQATGSGNGSGSAGVAIIGALSTATYNRIYIGGGPYEINPATVIEFWTHSTTTHNLGGTLRGYVDNGGNWFLGNTLWIDDADDYVGIGTTSPGAKLDVRGGALFVGDYTGTVTPTDGIWIERPAGNSTQIQMYTYGSSVFGISSDGTTANIGWGSGADREVNFQNTGAGNIKVGIGTGAPSQTLHVSGNARVTGAYYDSNNSSGTSGQVLSSTATGTDWVSLSEISGVDGTGTANTLAMWSDADTITDAPITVSGNNATFVGDIIATHAGTPTVKLIDTTNNLQARFRAANSYAYLSVDNPNNVGNSRLVFQVDGDEALHLDGSQNATFAGDVNINGGDLTITKQSDAPTMTLLHDGTNPSTSDLLFKMQFQSDYNDSHQNWGKIQLTTNASSVRTNLDFYVKSTGGNEELGLRIEGGSTTPKTYIYGDLIVEGDTTTLNTQTVEVEDNILQLNTTQGSPDTATATTSGISIYRGSGVTQASFIFDDADDTWDLTNNLAVDGNLTLNGRFYLAGTVDTNTSSTTALVLNGTEVEKRTLGSAAFSNTGDFAAASHTHDDRYYTETEADNRFVNVTGDTMTGSLNMGGNSISDAVIGFVNMGPTQGASPDYNYKYYRITNDLTFDKNRIYELLIDADDNAGYSAIYHIYISQHNNSGNNDRVRFHYISGDKDRAELLVATDEHVWVRATAKWGNIKIRAIHENEDVSSMPFATTETRPTTQADGTSDFVWNGDNNTFTDQEQWHAGNDGAGSGLDADLLDGNHASAFALSSHNHDSDYVNVTGDTMTGDLYLDDGDGATPSLYFKNGADNYWRYLMESGGDFSIKEGTSTRLTFQAGGNVGIGETNPVNPLSVYSATVNKIATFTSGDNGGLIEISDNDTTSYVGSEGSLTYIGQTAAASTNNLIIDSSGNVGIGETNPARSLEVNHSSQQGVARFVSGSTTMAFIDLKDANTTADNKVRFGAVGDELSLWANGERMRIDSNGNVGIGETNPGAKLVVAGGSDNLVAVFSSTDDVAQIEIVDNDTSTFLGSKNGLSYISPTAGTPADGLVVSSSGDVGIGEINPASKLQVAGGVQMADDTATASANKVGTLRYRTSGNNSYVDMCMQTGASTYEWINIVQNNW